MKPHVPFFKHHYCALAPVYVAKSRIEKLDANYLQQLSYKQYSHVQQPYTE